MVDYVRPAEYPYEDLPSTDTPVYAAALNGLVDAVFDLGAAGGRVADLEAAGGGLPVLSVTAYGAVGDGSTNDTAAIQDALDDVPDGGAIVFFPPGSYSVPSGGLTCENPVVLLGVPGLDGTGSRLVMTASSGTLLTLESPASVARDMTLYRAPSGTRNADLLGLVMADATLCRVETCVIEGFSTCVSMREGLYWHVERSWIRGPAAIGLEIRNLDNSDAGDMTVTGCTFDKGGDTASGAVAVLWRSGGGLRFTNNKINGGGSEPFTDALLLSVADGASTGVLTVTGNSVENFTGRGIAIELAGTTGVFGSSIAITGNEIASYNTEVDSTGIFIDVACTAVSITGNTIHDTDNGIVVDQLAHAAITGNGLSALVDVPLHIGGDCSDVIAHGNSEPATWDDPTSAADTPPPAFGVRAYADNTSQSVSSGSYDPVDLNTTEYNERPSLYTVDLTANTVTVAEGGLYLATFEGQFTGGSAGLRVIALEVNATQVNEASATGTTLGVNKTTSLRLDAGDAVRLMAYVDGGAGVDLETSSPWNVGLALVRLGS